MNWQPCTLEIGKTIKSSEQRFINWLAACLSPEKKVKNEFSKAFIICWWFCCSQLENFNRSHWLFAFTKKWDNIILNSCDVYCQRLKKLHVKEMIYISFYNWWIYLRLLCCENPFSAENFKISFLLQLKKPGDAASLIKVIFELQQQQHNYTWGESALRVISLPSIF